MQPLYGLQEKHALLDDVCDLMGVGDTSRYMKQPDDPQVIQGLQQQSQMSQQMHQLQMQMQQMQMQNQQLTSQLAIQKDERDWMKVRSDTTFTQAKIEDLYEDNIHDDDTLQLDREKAAAEYQIERDQQRPADI